ncbi:hypothetical protein Acr_05g0000930 [Actinidia rufa]|uniref:Uncharacterized protein n=1 Tax=Actinidia rufa TaxID=165716 RepID=A0A7J0EJ11_9ERIC|nr:hypothetical protein Acr_05g0000930 [Actinidia rufa]
MPPITVNSFEILNVILMIFVGHGQRGHQGWDANGMGVTAGGIQRWGSYWSGQRWSWPTGRGGDQRWELPEVRTRGGDGRRVWPEMVGEEREK